MEIITLPLAELKPALAGLSKVVTKRPTLPVLGMIKIERTADGWIALTGTDLDTFVTVRMEQPAPGQPFSVLVPLEDLQTTSKNCARTDTLQIHPHAPEKVLIKTPVGASWAETKCDTLPVAEFPVMPKFDGDIIAVPENVRTALHEAFSCASEDATREILQGAFLDVSKKDCHCVVGTDGRHLYSSNSFSLPMKGSVIIPTHRFLEWKEFNNDGEWRLKSGANAENKDLQHVQLTSRRWRFITRQIEGDYPNWRQVLPDAKQVKTTICIDNPEMVIQAMQRMPDHDNVYHAIGLMAAHGSLLLLAKSTAEDAQWFSVPIPNAKIEGADVQINLNRQQLTKALQFGLTRLEIIDELSPARICEGGRQMILMPVRINGTAPSAPPGNIPPAPNPPNPQPAPVENTPPVASQPPALEAAAAQIEIVRTHLRGSLAELGKLGDLLKQAQREHKAGDKEIQSVRQTLRQLQAVRI